MPKIKFTAVSIKNLKSTTKSTEYFDTGRENGSGALGIRISPKGKKTWFIMYANSVGKVKRFTLGTYPDMTLKSARDSSINIMADVNAGKDPMGEKAAFKSSETFSELWEYYLTAAGLGKKIKRFADKAETTQVEDKRRYDNHLKPALGDMKVKAIKRADIKKLLAGMSHTKHAANRMYAMLNVLFKHADDLEWITTNPMPLTFGEPEESRDRVLDKSEIKKIWPELKGKAGDIYKLILLTGQRSGQVMGMKWDELDLEDKLWTLQKTRTKNKKGVHGVPLSEQALQILENIKNDSEFVFPSRGNSDHIRWTSKFRDNVQKESKTEGWTAHDLRRTCRTIMSRLKVKTHIAELVLGHSQQGIIKVYDQYDYLDEKRKALDRLGREVDRITGIERAPAKIVQLRV